MTDELHFAVQVEEGERHPSDGRELRKIAHALERIEQQLRIQNQLLHELIDLDTPKYYPTIGGNISVE
jgi:hypothetical protein